MATSVLPSSLVSKFVKELNNLTAETSTKTIYGTAISYPNDLYVQFDGSDLVTPVEYDSTVNGGDRVIVTVTNHHAVVSTNLSEKSVADTLTEEALEQITESLAETLSSGSSSTLLSSVSSVVSSTVSSLTDELCSTIASMITVDEDGIVTLVTDILKAQYAEIGTLVADEIYASYAEIETLVADEIYASYANIETLVADTAIVNELYALYAEIEALLAGAVSARSIQSIVLNSENVVIDDATITSAMIVSLTADKITSGTIYTNLVSVQSGEDDAHLWISDSTIQIRDDAETCRVQIGEDGNGDYNLYLWDSDGNVLWNASGVTAAGINDEVIVDDHVSTAANISGSKLNIGSVVSSINDSTYTINSSNVVIDGTTLTAVYTSISCDISELSSDVESISDELLDMAESVSTLTTDFTVINGEISALITATNNYYGTDFTELNTAYSYLLETVDSITSEVSNLTSIFGSEDNEESLLYQISQVVQTYDSWTSTVEEIETTSVVSYTQYWCLSTSQTSNTQYTSWSTTYPTVSSGYYIWTRFLIVYGDDSTSYTTAYCVTGAEGENGEDGEDGSMLYATSSTAASTTAKTASLSSGSLTLTTGAMVSVRFTYKNSAYAPTLNVASTGAKNMYLNGSTVSSSNTFYWSAYSTVVFIYNGTYWVVLSCSEEVGATSKIEQLADSITLSVSTSDSGLASIELSVDDTTSSGTIDLSGYVTFSNLEEDGETIINGGNITTGIIDATSVGVYESFNVYTGDSDTPRGSCSTPYYTAIKVVSISSGTFSSLSDGALIIVTFKYRSNVTTPQLNVNSLGAKYIYINGSIVTTGNTFYWSAGDVIEFMYSSDDDGYIPVGGYMGYMTGLSDNNYTYGCGISDATENSYIIATGAGCRMQSGDYCNYITIGGVFYVDSVSASIVCSGDAVIGSGCSNMELASYTTTTTYLNGKDVRIGYNSACTSIYLGYGANASVSISANSISMGGSATSISIGGSTTSISIGGSSYSSSDLRVKNTIEDVTENYISLLDYLKPRTYYFNGSPVHHLGFIAQEVSQAFDDIQLQDEEALVYYNSEKDLYSLEYNGFIPILVAGYQKLKKRVDELEALLEATDN